VLGKRSEIKKKEKGKGESVMVLTRKGSYKILENKIAI
jgi:hypothetical protein